VTASARLAQAARPWIERLGRLGIGAKGIVYVTIGVVAVVTGVRRHGRLADREKALVDIAEEPLGRWVLLVVAIGLCGYVLWRLADAILDPWRHDRSLKGILRRVVSLVIAVGYGSFAVTALRLALAGQRPSGELAQNRAWTAEVLQFPGGSWLIGAVGVGIAIFGVVEVIRGVTGSFLKLLRRESPWGARIGRVGLGARGLVFIVLGGYVVAAAWFGDAHEVKGLDGVLRAVAQAGGGWVLALVGVGLVAYGIYQFFEAADRDFAAGGG
jgi:Domain of Unknown Function (DUF1206)